jgi:methionyl-tRNA formyltransferase
MLGPMRMVFLGSPEFALPSLRRLLENDHDVVAVYTQPDRPTGRGRRLAAPPVKTLALEHGIPVHQPKSISAPGSVEYLRELRPDVGVIAAYGQILRQAVLEVPPLGILNVHASLLPRWRGAAPIPAAILAGDAETGATIMKVVRALDAGPTLAAVRVPIGDDDTTATLTPIVAEAGAELLIDVLPRYARGEIAPLDQVESLTTYAPQLTKDDGRIDWATETAEHVWRKVRAYNPWPSAWTTLAGDQLRILSCLPLMSPPAAAPGTVVERRADDGPRIGFRVAAIDGAVGVVTVQPAGRPSMPAEAFARGRPGLLGAVLH